MASSVYPDSVDNVVLDVQAEMSSAVQSRIIRILNKEIAMLCQEMPLLWRWFYIPMQNGVTEYRLPAHVISVKMVGYRTASGSDFSPMTVVSRERANDSLLSVDPASGTPQDAWITTDELGFLIRLGATPSSDPADGFPRLEILTVCGPEVALESGGLLPAFLGPHGADWAANAVLFRLATGRSPDMIETYAALKAEHEAKIAQFHSSLSEQAPVEIINTTYREAAL